MKIAIRSYFYIARDDKFFLLLHFFYQQRQRRREKLPDQMFHIFVAWKTRQSKLEGVKQRRSKL